MSLETFRYTWDDYNSKFSPPPIGKNAPTELQNHLIKEVISKIETRSGIKKDSHLFSVILFFFLTISGYVAASFAISKNWMTIGPILILGTPMASFFITIGPMMVKEAQKKRIDNYMRSKGPSLTTKLQVGGMTYLSSFTLRNGILI